MVNTPRLIQNHDKNHKIREFLLRQHAVLRDRLQTLQREATEIGTDGLGLPGREEAQAAAEEVSRQIVETDLALAKLGNGTYGICDRCGQPIPPRRLEVLPTAARCVTCAASAARGTMSQTGRHAQRAGVSR